MLDRLELTESEYDKLECYEGLQRKIKRVQRHKQELIKQYKEDVQTVLTSNWRVSDEYIQRIHPESLVIHFVDAEASYNELLDSLMQRDQLYRKWLKEHSFIPLSDRDKVQAIKEIEITVPAKYRF